MREPGYRAARPARSWIFAIVAAGRVEIDL